MFRLRNFDYFVDNETKFLRQFLSFPVGRRRCETNLVIPNFCNFFTTNTWHHFCIMNCDGQLVKATPPEQLHQVYFNLKFLSHIKYTQDMRRPTKAKVSGVRILAWVSGTLWLLSWLAGGIALMIYEHVWPAVFCYCMSPVFLIVDIVMETREG